MSVPVGMLLRIVEQVDSKDPAHAPLAAITVTYSPGKHLGRLVDSLDAATARPTLLVCADNGSTDGVAERLARERADVEFLPTGGNVGYGAAINAAVRALRPRRDAGEIDGRYLLVTNPDVRFHPGSIDALVNCAEDAPGAGAVGPRIEEADGSVYPSAREVPGLVTGAGHALLSRVWPSNPFTAAYKAGQDMDTQRSAGWLSGACLLVRWDAFEQVGGFDERYFMYLEDIDFGDRLARAGWENVYCPRSVIAHDQGHVAGKHSRVTVPAHHASAYRFQADRHPRWWQGPLRAALWAGLKVRGAVAARRRGEER
ncbi:N-acetylglucosaminyl-diphospho-decaprenol L-rhamnosyltransferase [Corynebacterium auris]|nr:N-acetylglucosaminyl-diphospho-decaprenol L-rhamnosyltransferase [Corynebacterium auris]